jgi:hypothetical protein
VFLREEMRSRLEQGQLLLHAEPKACPRPDFPHADFLQPDALKAGAFKRPQTAA